MKINFRKIEVKDLDGNEERINVSKLLGNIIYNNTPDLGELEIAQDIYKNGEVDLTPEQATSIRKYADSFSPAYVIVAVRSALDKIINSKE